MIQCLYHIVNKVPLFFCIAFPLLGKAQHLPCLSFSSMYNSQSGSGWISQPIAQSLNSQCIMLNMGLALHYAEKRQGYFMAGCLTEDNLSEIQFVFYPNPVHSTAKLSVSSFTSIDQRVKLLIVDVLGRIVRSQWVKMQELNGGLIIDMSPLSSGSYFLVIQYSGISKLIKIIKIQ